jgi:multicomponent K+:H+ antiporter subunit A
MAQNVTFMQETAVLITPLLTIALGSLLALGLGRTRSNTVRMGWSLAFFPLSAFLLTLYAYTRALTGEPLAYSLSWIPALGLRFSLYLDGLSALFALLVTGIGALVVVYAGYYFDGHPPTATGRTRPEASAPAGMGEYRFFTYLLLFMLAMLGLVLAGDLITLFLFWEGTSITSFLLIAYKFKDEAARKGAFKSLFLTGGGGIALLAGFLFLTSLSGGADFGSVMASGDLLRANPLYPVFFSLIALGAFTKSAQFPAHIWLPEAMSAPTPASAFLHSATMVKAGIYLLARLNPAIGNTDLWFWTLSVVGLTTMLVGAYVGFKQHDLKALLAYSTISQLGVMVALIGQDTEIAFKALVISVLAHALYKSALFMTAGIIDHETGTRDLRGLGGLRVQMPRVFVIAGIAALSMAGLPPLFGFLAKETLLATATHPGLPAFVDTLFPLTTVLAGALILGQAGLVVWEVFLANPTDPRRPPSGHDPHPAFWLAPAIPAVLSLLIGLTPVEPAFLAGFLAEAARGAFGDKVKVSLALWTGINVPLILSFVAVTLGALVFWGRERIRAVMTGFLPGISANVIYEGTISGLNWLSKAATGLQLGRLRFYLAVIMLGAVGLVALFGGFPSFPGEQWDRLDLAGLDGLRLFSLVMLAVAGLVSIFMRRDLHAVIAVGISGLGVAVWMALEPAPDVALVQFVVDILAMVILVLSLNIIPRVQRERAQEFTHRQSRPGLLRDALVAALAGLVVMGVSFTALRTRPRESVVSPFYAENAKPLTGAKDIVGAIVVDFRATDTLVEIMVFSLAGLGIYTLLHYATRAGGEHSHEPSVRSLPEHTPLGIHDMPTSPFLHTLAYVMLPLAFLLGLTHMLYGHDQPGDGFTAGVIISLAIAEWYMLFGYSETRRRLPWLNPARLMTAGLGLALATALLGAAFGGGVFAPVDYGARLNLPLPPGLNLSNSLLFEIAIALSVMGAATMMIDNLGHPREEDLEAEAELAEIESTSTPSKGEGMEVL